MKTLKNQIFLEFILVLTLVGCSEDFLQKTPQGTLTQANFPVTESDALLATNGSYTILRDYFYGFGGFPILDFMSDDASRGSNLTANVAELEPFDKFAITPTSDGIDRWWAALYQGIRRANVVIERVPGVDMDMVLRNRYIGEAKFIRALMYFDLVRAWGGVPIVTTADPPVLVSRSSKEEVYDLIVSDLLFAIDNLSEQLSLPDAEAGRATKEAAKALLGKVYLFQKDFINAEKYLLEVINADIYGLEPVFTDANGENGNYGIESVFEIGALPTYDLYAGLNQYAIIQGILGVPNKGWGFNRPTMEFRRSFEPGDPRLKGTIIDLGDTIDGTIIVGDITANDPAVIIDANGDTISVQCYNRKVWMRTITDPTVAENGYHRKLIRYADVLLMAAEALNENDKPSQALVYLNMVRARARQGNNSILPDITVTEKNSLRDKILFERRHELAMENMRFWDLVRTGKAATILGPLGFVEGKHELLPIHQTVIDLSLGTITQNPNY